MGTSTAYEAPSTPQWRELKGKVTRLSRRGRPSAVSARSVLRDYIAANGGARQIAHGSGSLGRNREAQAVARNLAGFISSVGVLGAREALRQLGIEELDGRSVGEISLLLIAHLGGPSSTIDGVDARNALSRLRNDLLEDAETSADVERILEEYAQGEEFDSLLFNFFGYYLFEQFRRVFFERLVERVGESQAMAFLGRMFDFIKSALRHITLDQDISKIDWAGEQGGAIADDILQKTLAVFGG